MIEMKASIIETKEQRKHNRWIELVGKYIGKIVAIVVTPDEIVDGWQTWKMVGVWVDKLFCPYKMPIDEILRKQKNEYSK